MHRKPRLLVGGSSTESDKKARQVTAEELRRVMGRSGAKLDPNGLTIQGGQPGETTTGNG